MSRRSRRRQGTRSGGWLGRVAVGLLVVGMICAAVGYWALKRFLHSDGFRRQLSSEVSKVIGLEGRFAPFHWDGLVVDTVAFDADGPALVQTVAAERLHTEVYLKGVRRGVWELHGTTIGRLELVLDGRTRGEGDGPVAAPAPPPAPVKPGGWLPTKAEVDSLDVREVNVRALLDMGEVNADGLRVRAERAGGSQAYRARIEGGRIQLPFSLLPELRLNHAKARYQNGDVFVTETDAACFGNGRINGTGEWSSKTGRLAFDGRAWGIKCDEFLRPDWAKRLTGDASTTFVIDREDGALQAHGSLVITNGVLTNLPVLDALAAYADTRRYRVLPLSEARTDWHWQPDEFTLSKLVLASEGLVRLEGSLTVRGRVLDGTFRLGLPPGTLASIPGAEIDVFLPGERGLLWSPLRITGTLDDPQEDLTDRLTTAAQNRMFEIVPETGEKVLKFTRSMLEEVKPVENGVKVIDKAANTFLREAGGILDGVLGGGTPPPREEDPPPVPPQGK